MATGVTCPTIRYHPAIIAQAAATLGILSEGRFTLGLGSGERLTEHVVAAGHPSVSDRQAMLREAIEIIRSRREEDGRWLHEGTMRGRIPFLLEERGEPGRWTTLIATRVLKWWDAAQEAPS